MGLFIGTRFDGDGRRRVAALPQHVLHGTKPMMVSRARARGAIEAFLVDGYSTHSGQGGMLWIIREYADVKGIKLDIRGEPGTGFYVTRGG